jgi:hypothetical protein
MEFLHEDSQLQCHLIGTKLRKLICYLIASSEYMVVFESVEVVLQLADFLAICQYLVIEARPFFVSLIDHQQRVT